MQDYWELFFFRTLVFGQHLSDDLCNIFSDDVKLDVDNRAGFYLVKVCHLPGEGDDCHIKRLLL